MDIKTKIGERIHDLRSQKKLTQEEVAWGAEIDRSFMNHVENGRRNVSVETLAKIICNGLETNFKEFFSDEKLFNNPSRKKRG
jgi:transcriptional regulator with XRE-family HTH domain